MCSGGGKCLFSQAPNVTLLPQIPLYLWSHQPPLSQRYWYIWASSLYSCLQIYLLTLPTALHLGPWLRLKHTPYWKFLYSEDFFYYPSSHGHISQVFYRETGKEEYLPVGVSNTPLGLASLLPTPFPPYHNFCSLLLFPPP